MKIKIAIGIGHGADTYPPEKGIKDFAEFSFNNAVGKYAKQLLIYNGFDVFLPQPFDSNEVSLHRRSRLVNAEKCDIGFSIHADASGSSKAVGHHGFYWYKSTKGKRLAEIWLKHAKEILPNQSRGIQPSVPKTWTNFHMVRETHCPFILMEHGFFTNDHEREVYLKSPDFQMKCAVVIAKTACDYFDLDFKSPVEKKPIEFKSPAKKHWGDKHIERLKALGIISGDHEATDQITWAEFSVVVLRLIDKIEAK